MSERTEYERLRLDLMTATAAFENREAFAALDAYVTGLRERAERAEAALEQIEALVPDPYAMPADWSEQIAACAECQSYATHPIQAGICNRHRQPLWDRERHEEHEARAIGWRARSIAQAALAATRTAAPEGGTDG